MTVWETIRSKRAIRKFEDKPLSDDKINRILDEGRRTSLRPIPQAFRSQATASPRICLRKADGGGGNVGKRGRECVK